MRRSSLYWIALSCVLSLGAIGCADEGVGDPCTPETVPCDAKGQNCGYKNTEAYIEATSVQCRSRLCLVYKLDNGSEGMNPADPRKLSDKYPDDPNSVDLKDVQDSVYCTCRCRSGGGVKSNQELCDCPDGFRCEDLLNLGGPGIIGGYCIRK
ncbi:MAG TPA: hypothetical protein VI299_10865 [Polyangiales bacterium]